MAYTTAQLDTIIAQLEGTLTQPALIKYAEQEIQNRPTADIRGNIAYFKGLYGSASDAPVSLTPRIRTYFPFGGDRGF